MKSNGAARVRRVCCKQVYAVIKERVNGGHGVTVCGRQSPVDAATYNDEQTVYLSDSNSVEIRVIAARSTRDGRQFLLRYKGQYRHIRIRDN